MQQYVVTIRKWETRREMTDLKKRSQQHLQEICTMVRISALTFSCCLYLHFMLCTSAWPCRAPIYSLLTKLQITKWHRCFLVTWLIYCELFSSSDFLFEGVGEKRRTMEKMKWQHVISTEKLYTNALVVKVVFRGLRFFNYIYSILNDLTESINPIKPLSLVLVNKCGVLQDLVLYIFINSYKNLHSASTL